MEKARSREEETTRNEARKSSVSHVERVRPRRRKPRRSAWQRTVLPALKITAIVVAAIALGTPFAKKIARPFVLYNSESGATQQLQTELDTLKHQNASLERKIKHLETKEGAAQAARKLGWVKPGEITLVIPEDKKKHDSDKR